MSLSDRLQGSHLSQLLTRDPVRRIGAGESDAEEIKKHLFFKDVSFEDVYNRKIPPPYFPTIGNATDTSNFDQEFTREQPTLTPVHTQLSTADQQEFAGFSWVSLESPICQIMLLNWWDDRLRPGRLRDGSNGSESNVHMCIILMTVGSL